MIAVLGGGAFGTALALTWARAGRPVTLWMRDRAQAEETERSGATKGRLPGMRLPDDLTVTADFDATAGAEITCLAVPMQSIAGLLRERCDALAGRVLVACAKGVELGSGLGPTGVIARDCRGARGAVLTGPSFAVDIANGLPTALTLAAPDLDLATALQHALSTPTLRLYGTDDVAGAEAGGALKNVVALGAGMAIGAGLGDSARAAILTRGFGEMTLYAAARGADPATLTGLSGLGDLVLTATSEKSRNYRAGIAYGLGKEPEAGTTIEGVATARAMAEVAARDGLDLPVVGAICDVVDGRADVREAAERLLTRPLKAERQG